MPRQLDPRKIHYRDILHQHIADNPERFLDLGGEAERIGPPPESESDPEAERAFYAGLYDGVTFGLADELGAGWSALGAAFDDRDMGEVYDATLVEGRKEADRLEQLHPIAYGGGSIVGALVNPVTYVPGGALLQGARAASQAGRMAKLAIAAANLAKTGAIEGAVYGFNSGEGGLRNRLENARDEAATAALAGAVLPPAARATGKAAAHVAGAALDLPTKRVIGKITQTREEADALLEKARLLRRIDVNDADASWPEMGATAYDLAFGKGARLGNEMKVLHQGLYGQGYQTSDVALTRARMDRVGAVFVGPGYKAKPNKKVLSADKSLRYRGPATKPKVYATGQPGVQANLERDRIMKNRYRHNLHINIFDMLPTMPAQP